jgi:hypothetical protein
MNKSESPGPIITFLKERQKKAVVEDLAKRGITFTWGQLQDMIKALGPDAKIADIQKAIQEKSKARRRQ